MDMFEKKTLQVSRGYTYTYYVSRLETSSDKPLPALFFSHGWPDHAQMYFGVVSYLRKTLKTPYTIIIPDQLGAGGTSKPTDPAAYKLNNITQDLIEIIDTEKFTKVISIGHDWGSRIASRLYNFHPSYVVGLILLNVPYLLPSREPFDLQAFNDLTTNLFGYPVFAYWEFFTSPDAPQILKANVGRLFDAIHAAGPDSMKRFMCVPGALRKYLVAEPGSADDEPVEVRDYAKDPAFKQAFVDRMTRDGFEGFQNYYVAAVRNLQYDCERTIPEELDRVNVPFLYIECTEDAVCRPEFMKAAKAKGLLPDLEETMVEAAHWATYEKPHVLAGHIGNWLNRRF